MPKENLSCNVVLVRDLHGLYDVNTDTLCLEVYNICAVSAVLMDIEPDIFE